MFVYEYGNVILQKDRMGLKINDVLVCGDV